MSAAARPQTTTPTRDELIRAHTDAARRIALRMARRCPQWVQREDLIAAGMIGLVEAAERFDGTRTEPFLAFAEHRIRGAVLDELRRGDIMPRRMRQLARRISDVVHNLSHGGEPPSDQRIADALGVTVESYRDELSSLRNVDVERLDTQRIAVMRDLDVLPDAAASQREVRDQISTALASLAARDVTILGMYFVEEQTYQQIADTLAITPSRVCQLLWRAIARLRHQLAGEHAA